MNTYYGKQEQSMSMLLAMPMQRMMIACGEVSLSSFHPPRMFLSE
jgi:hypothetical protein